MILRVWEWYRKSLASQRRALQRGLPGAEFLRFGRRLGRRLLLRGIHSGLGFLLTPVQAFRYHEFDFANRWLSVGAGRFLDLSSPRLFSLFQAWRNPDAEILMLNPDREDIAASERFRRALGCGRLSTRLAGVEALEGLSRPFDAVWSISVIEHIVQTDGDAQALERLWRLVKPGGRLVISVPVGRTAFHETVPFDIYGTSKPNPDGTFFFQRVYDRPALEALFHRSIGRKPDGIEWVGEREAGFFDRYQQRMRDEGYGCTCEDAWTAVDALKVFPTWEEMPGFGCCCAAFVKGPP